MYASTKPFLSTAWISTLCVFALTIQPAVGQQSQSPPEAQKQTPASVVKGLVNTTNEFITTLNDEQKKKLMFKFSDIEQREKWSNLPSGIFDRAGLKMGDLNQKQKDGVFGILRATLSEAGFKQIIDNMNADEFLQKNNRPGRVVFGKDEFFISILGTPSTTKPWMYQFGGHHLAINITIVGDQLTHSPSLTGGQPMKYQWNGSEVSQHANELAVADKLINSLNESQLKQTVIGKNVTDLFYGPLSRSKTPRQMGIKVSELTDAQQKMAIRLIRSRIGILNPLHAQRELERITPTFAETYFCWQGSKKNGEPSSFKIMGPKILLEFSPQGRGPRSTQHVHAMYRDPSNDYGEAFVADLRQRLKTLQKK